MIKKTYLLILVLALISCDNTSKWKTQSVDMEKKKTKNMTEYEKKATHFRDSTSAMFLSGANGVLEKKDVSATGRLKYFEPNELYRMEAKFKPIENGEVFKMETSTDRLPEYKRFGTLSFMLEGAEQELTVYQNVEDTNYLFLPFRDLTNGNTTYGAGRYLNFMLADLENPLIDFNLAYNPYCAYNKDFSCPIPPVENHLKIEIPAGEKKWH